MSFARLIPSYACVLCALRPRAAVERDPARHSICSLSLGLVVDRPAGHPLVRPLPTSLDDAPVARYTVLEGPALSGAAGYSFTWITRDTTPGSYAILLRADHPDAAPDTLIVQVTVEAE
jgi:hypothetical protein